MIKILIAIIISIMGTANGITVGATMSNNAGNSFSDSATFSGNIGAHGEYLLNGDTAAGYISVQVGPSGSFGENTNVKSDLSCYHNAVNSKLVENPGSGTAYSDTGVCLFGQFIELESNLQTDSQIDHAEFRSAFETGHNRVSSALVNWHHENVESLAKLMMYDENNLAITPIKIAVSGTSFPAPNGFQKG